MNRKTKNIGKNEEFILLSRIKSIGRRNINSITDKLKYKKLIKNNPSLIDEIMKDKSKESIYTKEDVNSLITDILFEFKMKKQERRDILLNENEINILYNSCLFKIQQNDSPTNHQKYQFLKQLFSDILYEDYLCKL